ncbi:hypothetical protein CERSUDRAFT_110960 [Gelatoporia subvermispora B]|uniref:EVE domain-containing protein n=1 Tax=Ceriporiopsis subvermispora (strain B) TaxID=914234 RepID=M2R7F4_CERS8|nr:hypothetical protein CERSUDRAFT_110960 [Gelatoporia subvermispora B]
MTAKHWLMKAEPDSRVVKGKDVKFSVDDFQTIKTTPWEGVRNAEARNLMKEMQTGDQVLFYHSNCKNPGIAAFAEVEKEAYPDYTAWDETHPYYDPKTDKEKPKWFMVDVTFKARAANFVPLALLRRIAAASEPPHEVAYIGEEGVNAIKEMALVNRGRLSVQRVELNAWGIIQMLAEKGGWDNPSSGTSKPSANSKSLKAKKAAKKSGTADGDDVLPEKADKSTSSSTRKRKTRSDDGEEMVPRRSSRTKK